MTQPQPPSFLLGVVALRCKRSFKLMFRWLLLIIVLGLVDLTAAESPSFAAKSWFSNPFPWFSSARGTSSTDASSSSSSSPRGGSSSDNMSPSGTTIATSETMHMPSSPLSMNHHHHQNYHPTSHHHRYEEEGEDDEVWNAQPPQISLEEMESAIRLTCEWNRRLQVGALQQPKSWKHLHHHDTAITRNSNNMNDNSGVAHDWREQLPVEQRIPISSMGSLEDDDMLASLPLTIFHAKTPRRVHKKTLLPRQGIDRWGPDLAMYLQRLSELLGFADQLEAHGGRSIIPALAILYLDRACSVETPRSNGMMPTPFLTPRTVHRLCLVALLIATQAVKGGTTALHYYPRLEQPLGISLPQLLQMEAWMRGALGDPGLFVTPQQLISWRRIWNRTFPPPLQSQQEQEQQQQPPPPAQQQQLEESQQQQQQQQDPNIYHDYDHRHEETQQPLTHELPQQFHEQDHHLHPSCDQIVPPDQVVVSASSLQSHHHAPPPPQPKVEQEEQQQQQPEEHVLLQQVQYAATFHSYSNESPTMDDREHNVVTMVATSSTQIHWS